MVATETRGDVAMREMTESEKDRIEAEALRNSPLMKKIEGMSDQEIRARALESASRCHMMRDAVERDVLATAKVFEAYIRDGK